MSYEDELRTLQEWHKKEILRIDQEMPVGPGLDDRPSFEQKKIHKEYNRRLQKLKEKYAVKKST